MHYTRYILDIDKHNMTLLVIIYTFFGFVLTLITFIYFKVVRPQKRFYDIFKDQGIPCEPFVPIFGQLFDMIRANKQDKGMEYFNELARKHGNHFLFTMGPLPRFMLLEPELLADVLSRSKAEYYEKTSLLINIIKPFIGVHNLLISKHQEHERARKMLNPAFHSINLRSMVPIMSNETTKAIDSFLSTSSATVPIRLDTQLNSLTLSIIASSAFGQSFEMIPHAKETICHAFNDAKDIMQYRTLYMINQVKFLDELPFWGKHIVDEAKMKLDQFVNQSIVDRRSGKSLSLCSGQDILDLLLSAVDDQGEPFSDQQIKDEALTFILAGHETTGSLMTWALYVLMLHDDVLQACREEVDRVLPNGTVPTFEHLSDLQVIEAVLHETLRLYPTAPLFGRQCVKEHTITSSNGELKIHIPVNTMIVMNSYVMHRREDYWPRPLEFDYKRWMRDPVTGFKPKLPHPFAYLPFAAGPRNCIGQNFALLEDKVILAMFLQRCAFKLVPGQTIVPQMKGVTMAPKYGLSAYITTRDF
jgi:cytochrome P450